MSSRRCCEERENKNNILFFAVGFLRYPAGCGGRDGRTGGIGSDSSFHGHKKKSRGCCCRCRCWVCKGVFQERWDGGREEYVYERVLVSSVCIVPDSCARETWRERKRNKERPSVVEAARSKRNTSLDEEMDYAHDRISRSLDHFFFFWLASLLLPLIDLSLSSFHLTLPHFSWAVCPNPIS